MSYNSATIRDFLAGRPPFDQMSTAGLSRLSEKCQLLRYRMGQAVVVREEMPSQVVIVYQGQLRLLGYHPQNQMVVTLKLLGPGEVVGWAGLVREVACETAIASTEAICITLSS
ncbi:MAG TPA: cyclic nucleotide-binding domain-containing protein, partial [Candidatus Obscuribacterales bacterium]